MAVLADAASEAAAAHTNGNGNGGGPSVQPVTAATELLAIAEAAAVGLPASGSIDFEESRLVLSTDSLRASLDLLIEAGASMPAAPGTNGAAHAANGAASANGSRAGLAAVAAAEEEDEEGWEEEAAAVGRSSPALAILEDAAEPVEEEEKSGSWWDNFVGSLMGRK